MCLKPISVVTSYRHRHSHPRSRGHVSSNLIYPRLLSQSQTVVVGGLWNCQSAVRKADFISALASHYSFDYLALTETWISPQNIATPFALSSAYPFFSLTTRIRQGWWYRSQWAVSKEASGRVSKEASGRVSKETSGRASKEASGRASKEASGRASKEKSGRVSKEASGRVKETSGLPVKRRAGVPVKRRAGCQ
ncbi:hypothetical protein QTP70_018395 [Hemibagrus guttatus]|uniref:Uncharacterized protein n=1 Tax=Hemibagrus guttatus TaxID=175788 RepID=A0AAE0UQ68_9TELE|nr:hypothetical protein QTP70_018395 [Hemibagrus guttatus]